MPPLAPSTASSSAPLADRRRPKTFDDLLGQAHIWNKNSSLRKLVERDQFFGLIFWGPPGSGKTSLARLIGSISQRTLVSLSAVHATVKDIRQVLSESETSMQNGGKASILFLDEIHRLSKNQQDVLLPALEAGHIRLIGATTENPSFEVNAAVNSRALVFRFLPIDPVAMADILRKALADQTLCLPQIEIANDVLEALAVSASGDARRALNLLDALLYSVPDGTVCIDRELLQKFAPDLGIRYDRAGDAHYDTISAFIKSIRASHADAAVYYLARMLEAGEDPMFIARRIVIAASEDIGNANPTALLVATSAMQAVHMVGMPEARIILSQATTYLAASPKSNRSYVAINKAMEDAKTHGALEIPLSIRNAPTKLMKQFGYGAGYAYAHDQQEDAKKMQYLPDKLRGRKYYEPIPVGAEKQLMDVLKHLQPTGDQ